MDDSGMYVSLDIGTTSVKVIVAERVKGQINVLGVGNVPSVGVQRGVIVDIDKASEVVKSAVAQAEEKSSVTTIHNVIVGISAHLLKIEPCNGMIEIADQSREINNADVKNVTASAMIKNLPPEREIIDAIPDEFVVDGFDGIQDPRGMVGVRLEMHGHIMTGPKTILHNTQKVIEKAGLRAITFIVDPLAQGQVLLDDGEQDFGTALIDIGGGQTTAAIVRNHRLQATTVDNEGGEYITKDISRVLSTSVESAKKLKLEYGYADSFNVPKKNQFPVNVVGQSKPVSFSEKILSEIIQARLEQIFGRIKRNLAHDSAWNLPGGIVLTGGVAALPGISELAANYFDVNVKVYIPNQMGLRHPSFALPLSLVAYQSNLSQIDLLVHSAALAESTGGRSAHRVTGQSVRNNLGLRKSSRIHKPAPRPEIKQKSVRKKKHRLNNGIKRFFSDFFD